MRGLLERGYAVEILHRGVHEPANLPAVRHIHADPHFAETLHAALGARAYDVIVAMYGRLKTISAIAAGRCGQLVAIGGIPVYRGFFHPERARPTGMKLLISEDGPFADAPPPAVPGKMLDAEHAVFEQAARGSYRATVLRYSQIYGPHSVVPWEWAVVRRVLDGRARMLMPDGGLGIVSRCASRNAAGMVLSVVDQPEIADGHAFNCADDDQYTWLQWAQAIAGILGTEMEFIDIPSVVAPSLAAELLALADTAPHLLVSNRKAKQVLGFREVLPAAVALEETVEWLLANPVTAGQYPAYPASFDYDREDRLARAFAQAVEEIRAAVPDVLPAVGHPMAHPKTPGTAPDARGR